MDKDGSGEIDFDEFLTVIREEQNYSLSNNDSVEGTKRDRGSLKMLFGKQGVLRDLVEKKPTYSALDLKKIANMNPNKKKNAFMLKNKRDSVQKIAAMFKDVVKGKNNILDSCSEEDESSEIDESFIEYTRLK